MIEAGKRRRGVDRQPGLATVLVDNADGAIDVKRCLRMKADDRRACLGELRCQRVDGRDHQMDIDRHADMGLQRPAHQVLG